MRVKIGDTWYDSAEQPLCLETNAGEREQIANQLGTRYAIGPDDAFPTREAWFDWMGSDTYVPLVEVGCPGTGCTDQGCPAHYAAPQAELVVEPSAWAATAEKPGIKAYSLLFRADEVKAMDDWIEHMRHRGCAVSKSALYTAPPTPDVSGLVEVAQTMFGILEWQCDDMGDLLLTDEQRDNFPKVIAAHKQEGKPAEWMSPDRAPDTYQGSERSAFSEGYNAALSAGGKS